VPELGVEKRPAAVDVGTRRRPPREPLLWRGGCPAECAGKTASNNKGRRGWRALQLGHAADGTWARHGGPHWHRRTARAGVAGRPVAGQGEVEVAHMRDEELVALIGGWLPCCVDEHPGSVRRRRHNLLLTVNSCIKVRLDLQADKSPVVVKGPFFPRVVNPRYRIRGTNV
jgi:hypothetical protein